jgi:hypothetical protein
VPSVVGYQGLSKPPVKARDVAVRRIVSTVPPSSR